MLRRWQAVRGCFKATYSRGPVLTASSRPTGPVSISTTAAGTSYEKLTALSLRTLGFSLTHVGGRADRGVDLLGYWRLPIPAHGSQSGQSKAPDQDPSRNLSIPVVVQCKAYTTTPKPAWIRELQGAIATAPSHMGDPDDIVGVLVSKGRLTAGVKEAVMATERGLMFAQLQDDVAEGILGQLLWNSPVSNRVGQGLGSGFVHTVGEDGATRSELRLLWQGEVLQATNVGPGELEIPR